MTVKDAFNPLFLCAARVCEKSEAARNLVRDFEFRGKHRIVAQMRPEAIGEELVATLQGVRYRLDLRDRQQWDLYFNLYPRDELQLRRLLDLVRAGSTCIDVGANIGTYTLRFAKQVGEQGTVHAFEPDRANFARLTANAALNGLDRIIRCHQAAVSNRSGEVSFYRSDPGHSGWGSLVEFKDISFERDRVPAVTLDDFLTTEKVTEVEILKIDVEAHEPELLQGARRSLAAQVFRYILIECNGIRLAERGKTLNDLLNPILDAGYSPQSGEDTLNGIRKGEIPFETAFANFMFSRQLI